MVNFPHQIIKVTTINITFYVYVSMHRWSILIIVQRDATQSSLFIILQVHSTCFAYQPHPSSGVHTTLTTASGSGHIFVQLPPSDVTKLAGPRWWEVTCRIKNTLLCVASRWTIFNIWLLLSVRHDSIHHRIIVRCTLSTFNFQFIRTKCVKSSPVTGPEWPRGFQEVKVPRFRDNGTGWL